jgi:uncharacterized protein
MEVKLQWIWDEAKNQTNKWKHGLSFEAAQYVFADPLAMSQLDPCIDEERWQTIGLVGQLTVLVIHTWPEFNQEADEEVGRIISARRATVHERRSYEEETF